MLFEVRAVAVGGSAVGIFDEDIAGVLPDVPGPAQIGGAGLVGPGQQLRLERRVGGACGVFIAALGDDHRNAGAQDRLRIGIGSLTAAGQRVSGGAEGAAVGRIGV